MSSLKKMLRLCILVAFMSLTAVGVGFGGGVPISQTRKEDRIEILSEKQDEEEEDTEWQEIKY